MTKYYAGIGSRSTPQSVQTAMTEIAKRLEALGYTLRSGGAQGADKAFERGVSKRKEIFYANDCQEWCLQMVEENYLPPDRKNFRSWRPYVQKLIGRDMMQILGRNGEDPVDFVVCWTSDGKDSGGTGYAIRCAWQNCIPVYNLRSEGSLEALELMLRRLERKGK